MRLQLTSLSLLLLLLLLVLLSPRTTDLAECTLGEFLTGRHHGQSATVGYWLKQARTSVLPLLRALLRLVGGHCLLSPLSPLPRLTLLLHSQLRPRLTDTPQTPAGAY